jgi:hypothetical protein
MNDIYNKIKLQRNVALERLQAANEEIRFLTSTNEALQTKLNVVQVQLKTMAESVKAVILKLEAQRVAINN